MDQNFTLIYLYENLNDKDKEVNEIIDFSFNEFSEVLKELNIKSISPPEAVIEKILQYEKDCIH
ncbi:MAG: hypothetical protein RBT49_06995 [Bacteroidales bacterium]|nr:hypothetical protein [Bacteroidales bacterium]